MAEFKAQETGMGSAGTARARRRTARRPERSGRARAYGGRDDVLLQDVAKQWIRDHQDAALLTAFAVGVFVGSWMRG